jgi:hypothetical protein
MSLHWNHADSVLILFFWKLNCPSYIRRKNYYKVIFQACSNIWMFHIGVWHLQKSKWSAFLLTVPVPSASVEGSLFWGGPALTYATQRLTKFLQDVGNSSNFIHFVTDYVAWRLKAWLVDLQRKSIANQRLAKRTLTPATNRRRSPLIGNGSVSTFPWQRINTEKQNNGRSVRHGDLYSVRPAVMKELVQFIRGSEPSFGIRHS